MFMARVVGVVWATQKVEALSGKRLLLVQPIDGGLQPFSAPTMAVCDAVDAGAGDFVLVMDEGNSARQILGDKNAPVRTIVVGVLDQISVGETTHHLH